MAAPGERVGDDVAREDAQAMELSDGNIDMNAVTHGERDEGRNTERNETSTTARASGTTTTTATKRKTYARVKMPTPEDMYTADAMDNCALKTVMSTVLGGALGAVMGVAFGALEPMEVPSADAPKARLMDQVKAGARAAGARSWSYSKGFAAFGALYAGSECVVEKVRAKHDVVNSAYAGCFTGGVMARSGGPSGMAVGCATMAALSVAMDKFMDH